jgi:hypothetical protein
VKTYDPQSVQLVFKGIPFRGFADGTFISVERLTDTFGESVGAQGDVVRVRSRDRRGTVTATLQGTSPTNDLLSAIAIDDEEPSAADYAAGVGDLALKDLNGTTLAFAEHAWIVKLPNVDYATEHTPRQWVIRCAKLKLHVGGATL